jgi:eukaryotic-like serine/threonine-protein kinase
VAEWGVPGYTELKALGSGGSGHVVLSRHDASGTLVAIKYMHRRLLADPQWAQMFRGEAEVLAGLDDLNVVRLYEYVESASGAAIVMELVDGVSLREILTHQGATTPEAALVVLQGSLLGLAAAHRRGVVHRDYKPENVLVNGEGVSKLTDFGIASRTGDRPVPAGTLIYAPPEQFAGAPVTPASDIYAATATFYECLTGRPPFVADTAEALLYQHLSQPVPLDPVPDHLRPLVAAGMAKEPGDRPADGTTFVAALEAAASGAYGRDWEKRGRSHLGEAALLLAALWPAGAPPAVQSSAVERVNLSQGSRDSLESRHLRHLWHLRHLRHLQHLENLEDSGDGRDGGSSGDSGSSRDGQDRRAPRDRRYRHVGPVTAAVAAAGVIALIAAGTALAIGGSPAAKLSASMHPTVVQQVLLHQPLSPGSGSSSGSGSSPGSHKGSGPGSSGSSSSSSSGSSSSGSSSSGSGSSSASSSGSASASGSGSSSPPAPPALTGVSPASGTTAGGTAVTITGTGLAKATGVSFGGAAGTITADSGTQITVTSPAGQGTVNVTVTTPSGTSAVTAADRFTYVAPPPAVTGISPASGYTTGGTVVTITGTGLAGATGVSFGGVAGRITADSGTQVTVTSPQGQGTVNITVTTPSGTSAVTAADRFTYYEPIQ